MWLKYIKCQEKSPKCWKKTKMEIVQTGQLVEFDIFGKHYLPKLGLISAQGLKARCPACF